MIGLRILLDPGELRRQRAVEIHHEQLGVVGVVVVGVIPAQRLRRHVATFVEVGHELDRVDCRLAHLRIVDVNLAVLGDEILAVVGDHEVIEEIVAVVRPDRRDLQADAECPAHALLAQRVMDRLEEAPAFVPLVRNIFHLEAGLLDQVRPDMERDACLLHRRHIVGALLGGGVVEAGTKQRGFGVFGLLRRNHVAHVFEAVMPGVLRQDRCRCIMENQIRHITTCEGGDRLLVQRPERHDAEVELVAGELFVVSDRFLQRRVLLSDEALLKPDRRCLRLSLGDIGSR